MAWLPISFTVPQYMDGNGDPYSGAVLKFYQDGTTTNTNMATDNTGGTTLADVVLDANGYPSNGGSIFIPHIDQAYKLALYPTEAAADADTGAIWTIDNLSPADLTDTDTDELVKVSSNDTTAGYLNGKLVAGTDITLTENSDGGNETLTISAGSLMAYKSADESVSSATTGATLQDDDDLQITLQASKIYRIEFLLLPLSASADPDFKYQFIEPDGTFFLGITSWAGIGTSSPDGLSIKEDTAAQTFDLAAANPAVLIGRGVAITGGSGGTFKLQWAQGTSNATDVTLQKGSWMSASLLGA